MRLRPVWCAVVNNQEGFYCATLSTSQLRIRDILAGKKFSVLIALGIQLPCDLRMSNIDIQNLLVLGLYWIIPVGTQHVHCTCSMVMVQVHSVMYTSIEARFPCFFLQFLYVPFNSKCFFLFTCLHSFTTQFFHLQSERTHGENTIRKPMCTVN